MKKLHVLMLVGVCIVLSSCRTGPMIEERFAEDEMILTSDGTVTQEDSNKEVEGAVKEGEGETGTGLLINPVVLTPEQKLVQMKDAEIAQITEKLVEIKTERDTLLTTIESLERAPLSSKDVKERTKGKDLPFKKCGQLAYFQNNEWYEKFESLLAQRRVRLFGMDTLSIVDPESILAGCFSAAGDIAIFIVGADDLGKGFGLIRYDTKMDNIEMAHVDAAGKAQIGVPVQFGKRDGNVIHFTGRLEDADCRIEMEYDYDFIENDMMLKKECKKCGGGEEQCTEM